jgi:hypothetical protein
LSPITLDLEDYYSPYPSLKKLPEVDVVEGFDKILASHFAPPPNLDDLNLDHLLNF